MRRTTALIAVVFAVTTACPEPDLARSPDVRWDASPPRVVSTLPNESPFTYYWASDLDDRARFVVFASSVRDGMTGVYLRDMRRRAITRIDRWIKEDQPRPGAPADERLYSRGAGSVAISGNGRYIAFSYGLDTLVRNDGNGVRDVFRYDRLTEKLELVSMAASGAQADGASSEAAISRDGRFVAFISKAKNLGGRNHRSDVYVKDMRTGALTPASRGSGGYAKHNVYNLSMSDDGNRVVFVTTAEDLADADDNRAPDAYLTDLDAGGTKLVSLTSDGDAIDPLEYVESASHYRDAVADANISGDGRVVAFSSHANGIVPEDDNNNVDIFVRDLVKETTERVSITSSGGDAYRDEDRECGMNGQCFGFIASRQPLLSHDGRYVAFVSGAPLLEPRGFDDPHGTDEDVFVHDRVERGTVLVNRDYRGRPGRASNIYMGNISSDAKWITYSSDGRVLKERLGRGENGDVFLQRLPIPFESGRDG